jgi:hypothetical protein
VLTTSCIASFAEPAFPVVVSAVLTASSAPWSTVPPEVPEGAELPLAPVLGGLPLLPDEDDPHPASATSATTAAPPVQAVVRRVLLPVRV